ncbi:LHFPL tetraspan subfamily member 2 protein isoform X3 [Pseudopipra pipra]|uniref:LHFPL tetraspan subfamily member 2 protein isoform X3 n=1 Tax=Pseudopipra pipra TaxID=415032 RepID=UPI003138A61C
MAGQRLFLLFPEPVPAAVTLTGAHQAARGRGASLPSLASRPALVRALRRGRRCESGGRQCEGAGPGQGRAAASRPSPPLAAAPSLPPAEGGRVGAQRDPSPPLSVHGRGGSRKGRARRGGGRRRRRRQQSPSAEEPPLPGRGIARHLKWLTKPRDLEQWCVMSNSAQSLQPPPPACSVICQYEY